MSIRFRCPNESCAKTLKVTDESAGRPGKCPFCGTALVVPPLAPTNLPVEVAREAEPQPEPPLRPVPKSKPTSHQEDVWDEDLDIPARPSGRVLSYGAIGLGWQLLRNQFGTWVLATFMMGLLIAGLGIVLQAMMIGLFLVETYFLGPHPVPWVLPVFVLLNAGIQGWLIGGFIRMALKQIDGGEIGVGDIFSLGGPGNAERLFKGMLLFIILTMIGSFFLIIPGLIIASLSMFTFHLIVDGRMGAIAALKTSVRTLRREWFTALLFYIAIAVIAGSGMLFLLIGSLVTLPWFVLAMTAQYRRSFAPGAKPRAVVVEDPYAEAIGIPLSERTVPRTPIAAWALMTFGLVTPVAALGGMIMTLLPAIERARERAQQFRAQTKGVNRPINLAATKGAEAPPIMSPAAPGAEKVRRPSPANALKNLRGGDLSERLAACTWLADQEPEADEPLRAEVATALEQLLRQPKDEAREPSVAAQALVRWATIDNLPALAVSTWSDNVWISKPAKEALDRLQEQADPATRKAIVNAIARGRDEARIEAIDRAVKTAKDGALAPGSRINALKRLAQEPVDPNLQDTVVSAMMTLLTDANTVICDNAIAVLDVWGKPGDHRALLALLDNKMPAVRSKAVKALAKVKDPEVIAKIVALAEEPRMLGEVRTAVRSYGAEAEPALLNLLENGSDRAQVAACQMLETVGTEKCLPALRQAQQSPNSRIQSAARRAVRALEQKLGLPSSETPKPKPKRKSRPQSNPRQGGTRSPSRDSSAQRDPESAAQR